MKMKKIMGILSSAIMLTMLLATPVSAADMEGPVGDVTTYYGTPTPDGVISEGEYDGARKVEINHTNLKALPDMFTNSKVPESLKITSYQLWDNTGLYLAFDIEDETAARGNVDGSNNWYFDGDNIQIFLDPGPTLAGQMLLDVEARGGRRAPMYTIGINADGTVYLLRQLVQNEMIANLAEVPWSCGGKEADYGWTFELCIPWDMLITDIAEKVDECTLSKDDVKEGMEIRAMFIYNDMKLSGDTRTQIGMYESCLRTSDPFDWQPEIFGINLILSETAQRDAPPYEAPTTENPEEPEKPEEPEGYRQVTVDQNSSTAGKDTQTKDSVLTWALGIGIALIVVALVVVVCCLIRRKKNSIGRPVGWDKKTKSSDQSDSVD